VLNKFSVTNQKKKHFIFTKIGRFGGEELIAGCFWSIFIIICYDTRYVTSRLRTLNEIKCEQTEANGKYVILNFLLKIAGYFNTFY
jgi:hypothetical protein